MQCVVVFEMYEYANFGPMFIWKRQRAWNSRETLRKRYRVHSRLNDGSAPGSSSSSLQPPGAAGTWRTQRAPLVFETHSVQQVNFVATTWAALRNDLNTIPT